MHVPSPLPKRIPRQIRKPTSAFHNQEVQYSTRKPSTVMHVRISDKNLALLKMSSLSVCTPWQHTSVETLRTIDSPLSLCLHVGFKSYIHSSFPHGVRVTMPLVAWSAFILLLSWTRSKRGPFNIQRVFPSSRCWQYLLSTVFNHGRNMMKSASLFFHHSILMSNQQHSDEP